MAKTSGIVAGMTGFAAIAEAVPPVATRTFTRMLARSAASAESRS